MPETERFCGFAAGMAVWQVCRAHPPAPPSSDPLFLSKSEGELQELPYEQKGTRVQGLTYGSYSKPICQQPP